jgi:hypothetical protein
MLFVSQNCCTLFSYKLCVVFVVQLSNIKKLQIKFKIEIHVISVLFVNCVTETELIKPNVNRKTYSPLISAK